MDISRRSRFFIFLLASILITYMLYMYSNKARALIYMNTTEIRDKYNIHVGKTNEKEDKTLMPRIIHQVWNDAIIPTEFVENVKGLVVHNGPPKWKYYFWTMETARKLIKERYPELLKIFDSYSGGLHRADLIRYVFLHEFGGAYFDLDTVSVKPLEPFMKQHSCAFVNEPAEHYAIAYGMDMLVTNSAMFCRPRHPFLRYIIDTLIKNSGCMSTDRSQAQQCTGPTAITRIYKTYIKTSNEKLDIVDIELFQDKYDAKSLSKHVTTKCKNIANLNNIVKNACQIYLARGGDARNISTHAYTYHTWYHVNPKTHKNISFKKENNISYIVPHVTMYT